ncbi:MAG: cytochrome c [Gammaproteobacteria bacterium]|nr:MAG: cytochrome c [Gammaproteobacteria bacterium]
MSNSLRNYALAIVALAGLALSPLAISHLDEDELPQSYRQSWFAMLAANFGPMVAMVKKEIPWDERQMAGYADQLTALTTLDILRGFKDGSDKGTTRAKPEIWETKADFEGKMKDLKNEVAKLQTVANTNDRKAIAQQVVATGEACGACHDDYKAKNYLY